MSDRHPINIAIVGTGLISKQHIPAVQQTAGTRLAGIFDIDRARATAAAAEHNVDRVYADLDEMLRDRQVDAVVVAVPNKYHADIAVRVARAGKHVLLEKPVASDVASARTIVAACTDAGITLRIAHSERSSAAAALARKLVAAGVIGAVKSFRSVFSQTWSVVSIDDYRWNLPVSGGATLMDLTVHRLDIIRYLLGARYRAVAASLRHSVMPRPVDDNVHLIVEMDGGISGVFSSDRFSPVLQDATELYGTGGSLHLAQEAVSGFHSAPLAVFTEKDPASLPDELASQLRVRSHSNDRAVPHDGWYQLFPSNRNVFLTQMQAFVALLAGEEPAIALSTGEEGVHYLELVQAAYIAQIERRWVEIPMPADAPWRLPQYT